MTAKQLEKLINKTKEPYIEIGGPTVEPGYELLKRIRTDMLHRARITNVKQGMIHCPYIYSHESYVKLHLDEEVDVREMPYKNDSIGIIICKDLPIFCSAEVEAFMDPTEIRTPTEEEWDQQEELSNECYAVCKQQKKLKNYQNAPRVALLDQSCRVLRKNGLLIVENLLARDIALARFTKLKLIYRYSKDGDSTVVFQKT